MWWSQYTKKDQQNIEAMSPAARLGAVLLALVLTAVVLVLLFAFVV